MRNALKFARRVGHIEDMDTVDSFETFMLDEAAIANFVKLQRTFNGWKQDMLAAEAGVSLATVSRVERGQKVRPAQLRKLARALGKPEDEFVRQRVRPTPEEAAANFVEMFAWSEGRVPVAVAPFRTELQLRATLATFSLLLVSDLDDDAADDVAELREWFDLASFVQAEREGVIGPNGLVTVLRRSRISLCYLGLKGERADA
ncbi:MULTISPECIES: helix-turn-helix domain-containing protein, partial [unclassified Sphingobium]|uniref:helix-turn-helix domain-containing protein n=1 Tax=unclassified Sphingobium TaxID=2611147 RepID=UPI0035A5E601